MRSVGRLGISRAQMRRDANVHLFGYQQIKMTTQLNFVLVLWTRPLFPEEDEDYTTDGGDVASSVKLQSAERRRRSQKILYRVVVVVVVVVP